MIDKDLFHLQPSMTAAVRGFLNDVRYEAKHNHQVKVPHLFVAEGLRSYTRQNYLYAKRPRVTYAKGGKSYHNFGLAVDVYPLVGGTDQVDWDFNPKTPGWKRILQLAEKNGLNWGGHWYRLKDYPHFELKKKPFLWQCRKKWPKGWEV